MNDAASAPKPAPEDRTIPRAEKKKRSKVVFLLSSAFVVFLLGGLVVYLAVGQYKTRTAQNVVTIPELGQQIAKGMEPYLRALTDGLNSTNAQVAETKKDVNALKADVGTKIDTLGKQIGDLQKQVEDLKNRPLRLDTKQLDETIRKSLQQSLPQLQKPQVNYSAVPVPPAKPKIVEASVPLPTPASRASVPPPAKPEVQDAAAPLVCTRGVAVRQSEAAFRIDTLVVEDGSSVVDLIGREGGEYAAWASPLLTAARRGSVRRFSGNGTLTFHLLNIDSAKLPDRIPYLEGEARCAGEAAVVPRGDGRADIEVPIDASHAGQVSLVLPAGAVARSGASVCIEADFSLAYVPRLTAGSYKDAKNVVCDQSFRKPLSAGFRGELLVLIHGQERKV